MRTTRSSSCPGEVSTRHLPGADPPRSRPPSPSEQTPHCKACWDTTCNACWDATPLVNRMTDRCKNITLPQTSFAGGKNSIVEHTKRQSWHDIYPNITNFVHFWKIVVDHNRSSVKCNESRCGVRFSVRIWNIYSFYLLFHVFHMFPSIFMTFDNDDTFICDTFSWKSVFVQGGIFVQTPSEYS